MAPVELAAATFDGVEDKGKAVVRQRWHLTPAAVVATAEREGSSIDVGAGVGGGGGGGSGGGEGSDGTGGWCGRCWWQWR